MNWRAALELLPKEKKTPRSQFAARTKQEARVTALIIVYKLIESYTMGGQPYEGAMDSGVPEKDANRLHTEIQKIMDSLDLRIQRTLQSELRKKG